jgi:hypothetical protein
MELIGELERLFATTLYPYRVPLAVAGAVVASLLAVAAVRGRWDLVARRHPRGTTALLVPLLVIGLPLGWYLGSPLFLSTTVDEPPPMVVGPVDPASDPPPIASPAAPAPTGGAAAPSPADPGTAAPLLSRSGAFSGADDFHFGRGTALLIETAPGTYTVRLEGFEVRNGPDLFVYLSPSAEGYAQGAVELAPLKADRGNQNYEVPAGTSIEDVRSIVIWCRQFAVLFATAPLS